MRFIKKLVLAIVILVLFASYKTPILGLEAGNSDGNIYQGGNIVSDSKYIYFSDLKCNSIGLCNLYKMKNGTYTKIKIADNVEGYLPNINVVDGWVYYIGCESQYGQEFIYKVKIDGTKKTKVIKLEEKHEYPVHQIVKGNWIYYIQYSHDNYNSKIYKVRTNGKDKTILYKGKDRISSFSLSSKDLFFINEGNVYKINCDGKGLKKIASKDYIQVIYYNDKIYAIKDIYSNKILKNSKIYSMKIDGTSKKVIYNSKKIVGSINIYDKKIYFDLDDADNNRMPFNEDYDKGLYLMNLNGSSIKKLRNNSGRFFISTGYIYDLNCVKDGNWYKERFIKIKLNGTYVKTILSHKPSGMG